MISDVRYNKFVEEVNELVGDEYTVLRKPTEEEIKQVKANDYKVLIRHNICGKEYFIKPDKFITRGQRCQCSTHPSRNKGIEGFRKELEEKTKDFELCEDSVYVNNMTPIKLFHKHPMECFESHYTMVRPYDFLHKKSFDRCPNCSKNYGKSTKEFSYEVANLTNGEYQVVSEYKNCHTNIRLKHLKCGYEFDVTPTNFFGGKNCPKCFKKESKEENAVKVYIREELKISNIIENDKSILKNQELDLYLPDYKIAFEFDGLYFHSELFKDKDYHNNKTNKCLEQGIQLIHIFEDEWKNNQDLVKDKIKYLLNKSNNEKIYARKCYVEEISAADKNTFLTENHIQGKDNSSIKLGLWYNIGDEDLLVAVMTFCKPRKSLGQNKNSIYDYELTRFATDTNYIVIGAFGKLFKYFKDNYEWNKIITYADRRWSKGDLYIKNNFKLEHTSSPNYWYINSRDGNKRIHRYNFRKNKLKELFPDIYSDDKTEFEIMKEAKYYKIWDCGNLVFSYTK